MIKHAPLLLALAAFGCDAGAKPAPKASVTLTSVAFADDCGGTPPHAAPASAAKVAAKPARSAPAQDVAPASPAVVAPGDVAAARRCEQTSMQLSIAGKAATVLRIKSVEVFDAKGKLLGALEASKPTRWNADKAAYETWDEKVGTGTLNVSYVLSQPSFVDQWSERSQTFTVKVTASLGGVNTPLKTTVMVVGRPPPVPT